MKKVLRILFLIYIPFTAASAHAQEAYIMRHLTAQEIERVKMVKQMLEGVDAQSLSATIEELEKSKHPHLNLIMKEATARAYTDIVNQMNVEGRKKKEWLYSMVCLNMAYLQFAGSQGDPRSTSDLNRLIRQKLLKYLPSNVFKQAGFVCSLE